MRRMVFWSQKIEASTFPADFALGQTKDLSVPQYIYRVIQEESALLWEMIVWVILSKKVHANMGPILNGYGVMGIF